MSYSDEVHLKALTAHAKTVAECERLRAQLAAMTTARDEACDIALSLAPDSETVQRDIAELRAVGK
jgi:hypothetical protein